MSYSDLAAQRHPHTGGRRVTQRVRYTIGGKRQEWEACRQRYTGGPPGNQGGQQGGCAKTAREYRAIGFQNGTKIWTKTTFFEQMR